MVTVTAHGISPARTSVASGNLTVFLCDAKAPQFHSAEHERGGMPQSRVGDKLPAKQREAVSASIDCASYFDFCFSEGVPVSLAMARTHTGCAQNLSARKLAKMR
jgi:hypothetical protein